MALPWRSVVVAVVTLPLAWFWAHREPGDGLLDPEVDPDLLRLDRLQLQDVLLAPPRPPGKGGDIAVIVLDTVRADRLGVYGYDQGTTPHLDAWAEGARVYTNMTADATWTLPTHASLFTGLVPAAHGAHGVSPQSRSIAAPLSPDVPTVAEALQAAGYWTVGIAANRAFLQSSWGLSRGFDVWMCNQLERDPRALYLEAGRVTAMAEQVLDQKGDRPLFLFLNYMDAHAPWLPRRGYVHDPDAVDPKTLPYDDGWEAAKTRLLAAHERDPKVLRSWSLVYDSELRYLDEQLAPLLARLDGFSRVIILGDHGEYLGEHDLVEHSKDVYEPVLHVPLLVKGESPGRDDRPIQQHDVAAMILDAAGAPRFPTMETTGELVVSELYWTRKQDLQATWGRRWDRVRRAFRVGGHKLVLSSDGKDEAYDLFRDPAEKTNVRGAAWVPELRTRADEWLALHPVRDVVDAKGTDVRALEELGYVDGR